MLICSPVARTSRRERERERQEVTTKHNMNQTYIHMNYCQTTSSFLHSGMEASEYPEGQKTHSKHYK